MSSTTQQSKNIVDAHLGIESRQIDKYIREKDLGVITPDDIAEALIYYGGVKACAVDFSKVTRKYNRVNKWFAARDAKRKGIFDSIGKCGVIQFQELVSGIVFVTTEEYAGGEKREYVMENYMM